MPKCVFKEFAKDNNGFYKYNIQNSVINRGFPKSTFTEEGYYSDTMEKMLVRLDMDIEYLQKRSLWLDIKLIFTTFVYIINGKKF